ncbi:MAG: winged helix DNA-binding protein [Sneathiellaceae bacterium]
MSDIYLDITRAIERLHRRFLDVIRHELNRLGVDDLNSMQALLLTNIRDQEVTARDLMEKGYYIGSNISYNIKQLTDSGYVEQERSPRDKRSVLLRLTDKGLALCTRLQELQNSQADAFVEGDVSEDSAVLVRDVLKRLERQWADYIHYGPG